ncbi:MAG: diaminopimelate decarboxylase, partial [Desulfobacterales bacterium]|nr:diaminopimelate decarboxylase [Desulfobacterales bacterium]
MPMSEDLSRRLEPILDDIAAHFGTPFHIYDEKGIRDNAKAFAQHFQTPEGYREYFAVKALPNRRILELLASEGIGFDCSSIPELVLARMVGAAEDDIMFTSNNTTSEEFEAARADGGSIINLDDISLIDKLNPFPERICFRYNPGARRTGNAIIGNPVEAKYGVSHDQIVPAYRQALQRGARRFGLHTMVASNELDYRHIAETTRMLLDIAALVGQALDIRFEFINIGGGIGIPYQPDQADFDLAALSREIRQGFMDFRRRNGYTPQLFMECGRCMT